MIKIIMALVMVLVMSGISYATSEIKEKAKVTIKIATLLPRGSTVMETMQKLGTEVREKTNNEVSFKFYWGGVQGDEKEVILKMRLKQLHGAAFTGIGLSKFVHLLNQFSLNHKPTIKDLIEFNIYI